MAAKQKKEKKITPLMGQYNMIKSKHPGALLLFRIGDFYETFGEDAIKTSKILGIVLTARNNGDSTHDAGHRSCQGEGKTGGPRRHNNTLI